MLTRDVLKPGGWADQVIIIFIRGARKAKVTTIATALQWHEHVLAGPASVCRGNSQAALRRKLLQGKREQYFFEKHFPRYFFRQKVWQASFLPVTVILFSGRCNRRLQVQPLQPYCKRRPLAGEEASKVQGDFPTEIIIANHSKSLSAGFNGRKEPEHLWVSNVPFVLQALHNR